MKLVIDISLDNAAFADDVGVGVAYVFDQITTQLDGQKPEEAVKFGAFTLFDRNGNRVGKAVLEP